MKLLTWWELLILSVRFWLRWVSSTIKIYIISVKNSKGYDILPYLWASKLTCLSFMDVNRRQGTPGSETKDLMTHCIGGSLSSVFVWVPLEPHVPLGQCGAAQVDSAHSLGSHHSSDTLSFGKSGLLKGLLASLLDLYFWGKHYLYNPKQKTNRPLFHTEIPALASRLFSIQTSFKR